MYTVLASSLLASTTRDAARSLLQCWLREGGEAALLARGILERDEASLRTAVSALAASEDWWLAVWHYALLVDQAKKIPVLERAAARAVARRNDLWAALLLTRMIAYLPTREKPAIAEYTLDRIRSPLPRLLALTSLFPYLHDQVSAIEEIEALVEPVFLTLPDQPAFIRACGLEAVACGVARIASLHDPRVVVESAVGTEIAQPYAQNAPLACFEIASRFAGRALRLFHALYDVFSEASAAVLQAYAYWQLATRLPSEKRASVLEQGLAVIDRVEREVRRVQEPLVLQTLAAYRIPLLWLYTCLTTEWIDLPYAILRTSFTIDRMLDAVGEMEGLEALYGWSLNNAARALLYASRLEPVLGRRRQHVRRALQLLRAASDVFTTHQLPRGLSYALHGLVVAACELATLETATAAKQALQEAETALKEWQQLIESVPSPHSSRVLAAVEEGWVRFYGVRSLVENDPQLMEHALSRCTALCNLSDLPETTLALLHETAGLLAAALAARTHDPDLLHQAFQHAKRVQQVWLKTPYTLQTVRGLLLQARTYAAADLAASFQATLLEAEAVLTTALRHAPQWLCSEISAVFRTSLSLSKPFDVHEVRRLLRKLKTAKIVRWMEAIELLEALLSDRTPHYEGLPAFEQALPGAIPSKPQLPCLVVPPPRVLSPIIDRFSCPT